MPAVIDEPISSVAVDRFGFLVRGWIWMAERQTNIAAIEAVVDGRVIGSTDRLLIRPDVNDALRLDAKTCAGFELFAAAGEFPRGSTLRLGVRVRFANEEVSDVLSERLTATLGADDVGTLPAAEDQGASEADSIVAEPTPPEFLQVRQVGNVWGHHFFKEGRIISRQIAWLADDAGMRFGTGHRILDFGCGCGRVLRGLGAFAGGATIWGCDVDADAIRWNQSNLRHLAQFAATPPIPPSPFSNGEFDFVYAISVFTHLPEEVQFAWLTELRRIIRPGGLLVASLHGGHYWSASPSDVRQELVKRGFAYRVGTATDGLPEYYMVAFHSESYVRTKWARFFDFVGFRERYIHGVHDAVVMRRPET